MSYGVITHSGKAHIDEILAIATLAVFKNEAPDKILRLLETEIQAAIDKEDGELWVIDCGLRYDPEKRFFDHHHDGNLESAAQLVFHHCFPELEDSSLGEYFRLVSQVDTKGLLSLGEGDSGSDFVLYWSMLHQMLVKEFESHPYPVIELVSRGLSKKMDFEKTIKAAEEWLLAEQHLVKVDVDGITALEYREKPPAELLEGLKNLDQLYAEKQKALAIYGFDKNNQEVRTLYRTDAGHTILDFTRATFSKAFFVHQNGFLARFQPEDDQEWRRILSQSRIG